MYRLVAMTSRRYAFRRVRYDSLCPFYVETNLTLFTQKIANVTPLGLGFANKKKQTRSQKLSQLKKDGCRV
jgi:hypothetical protein